jgi:hypothetical protein
MLTTIEVMAGTQNCFNCALQVPQCGRKKHTGIGFCRYPWKPFVDSLTAASLDNQETKKGGE